MYFMRLSLSDLASSLSLAADLAGPVALGVVLLVIWALFAVIDARKTKLAVQRYESRTAGFLEDLTRAERRLEMPATAAARSVASDSGGPWDSSPR